MANFVWENFSINSFRKHVISSVLWYIFVPSETDNWILCILMKAVSLSAPLSTWWKCEPCREQSPHQGRSSRSSCSSPRRSRTRPRTPPSPRSCPCPPQWDVRSDNDWRSPSTDGSSRCRPAPPLHPASTSPAPPPPTPRKVSDCWLHSSSNFHSHLFFTGWAAIVKRASNIFVPKNLFCLLRKSGWGFVAASWAAAAATFQAFARLTVSQNPVSSSPLGGKSQNWQMVKTSRIFRPTQLFPFSAFVKLDRLPLISGSEIACFLVASSWNYCKLCLTTKRLNLSQTNQMLWKRDHPRWGSLGTCNHSELQKESLKFFKI